MLHSLRFVTHGESMVPRTFLLTLITSLLVTTLAAIVPSAAGAATSTKAAGSTTAAETDNSWKDFRPQFRVTHLARTGKRSKPVVLHAECRRPLPFGHAVVGAITTPYKLSVKGRRRYIPLASFQHDLLAGDEDLTRCGSARPLVLKSWEASVGHNWQPSYDRRMKDPLRDYSTLPLTKAQLRKVERTFRRGTRLRVEYHHQWGPANSMESWSRFLGARVFKVLRTKDLPVHEGPECCSQDPADAGQQDEQAARWTARVTRLERRASGKYPLRVTMRSSRKATLTGSVYGVVTTTTKMKVLGRKRYIPLATFGYMKGASFPQARLNARRDLGGLPTHMQRIDEPDVKSEDLVGRFGAMPLNAAQKRAADRALRRGKRLRVRLYEAVAPDVHSADLQYRLIRTQVITVRR